MRDIFLSYASEDRDRAQRLVEALEASGWTVWWDRRLAVGSNYEEEIQNHLEASRCVVVLWTQSSVRSRWVKAEAQDAAERGQLFPAFLDRVKAPLEYRYLNGVDLMQWDGSRLDPEFARLHESLRSRVGSPSGPMAEPAAPAPAAAGSPAPRPETPTRSPTPTAAAEPADDPSSGPGEVTAMRLIAAELAEVLDRIARRSRGRRPRPSVDGKPGEVTIARAVSRRLAEALARFAESRGRVRSASLVVRYLAWTFAVPTALLLVFHGVVALLRSTP